MSLLFDVGDAFFFCSGRDAKIVLLRVPTLLLFICLVFSIVTFVDTYRFMQVSSCIQTCCFRYGPLRSTFLLVFSLCVL